MSIVCLNAAGAIVGIMELGIRSVKLNFSFVPECGMSEFGRQWE